jgi:hypothetical protein
MKGGHFFPEENPAETALLVKQSSLHETSITDFLATYELTSTSGLCLQ